jgi:hypothetical protein
MVFWKIAYEGMLLLSTKNEDGYEHDGHPKVAGTVGKCIAPQRYQKHKTRWGFDAYHPEEPGIYEKDGNWLVSWQIEGTMFGKPFKTWGPPVSVSTYNCEVHPDSKVEYDKRYQELWVMPVLKDKTIDSYEQENILLHSVRIGDLPETNFWEGDILAPVDDFYHADNEGFLRRVSSIQFDIKKVDRGQCYIIEWCDRQGEYAKQGTMWLHDCNNRLVERGNLWKKYHGEPLTFRSLLEETSFAANTGQREEMRNPASGDYRWDFLTDIIAAIRDGIGDAFTGGQGIFGSGFHHSVYRFKDRDLGERVRAETLMGFVSDKNNTLMAIDKVSEMVIDYQKRSYDDLSDEWMEPKSPQTKAYNGRRARELLFRLIDLKSTAIDNGWL